ncbi:protein FAM3C-like [Lampetra fluviatilis]
MRIPAFVQIVGVALFLIVVLYVGNRTLELNLEKKIKDMLPAEIKIVAVQRKEVENNSPEEKKPYFKCGLPEPCPDKHLPFRVLTGAANIVGPKICLDDQIIMSSARNNVGRGFNIVSVDGAKGNVLEVHTSDVYNGEIDKLIAFLKTIKDGSIVIIASFDDASTNLNDEARGLLADLGSKFIKDLGMRDNWVFIGGKGLNLKTSYERHIKSNKDTNKYEGWPELLELEGCIPLKLD